METMKLIVCAAFIVSAAHAVTKEKLQCELKDSVPITTEWIDTKPKCTEIVENQVQKELNASLTYLAMAAHFSKDHVNRPGFAELFYKSASEERDHAIALMDYLLMRGELSEKLLEYDETKARGDVPQLKTTWASAVEAVEDALNLEALVTRSIRDIIKQCENEEAKEGPFNDYHIVDYLTGDFLTEQYHGQRELAGHAATLKKMVAAQGKVGEFLYDKQISK